MKHYRAMLDLGMFHGHDEKDVRERVDEFISQCLMDMLCRETPPIDIVYERDCPGDEEDGCDEY